MSLRTKVLTIIAVIIGLYGIANYAVQRKVIYPSFVRLEREDAVTNLQRCVGAIEREVQQLCAIAGDYGAWDDTAKFVSDGNQKYIDDNITASGMKNINVNVLCICNPQGKVSVLKTLNLETQEDMEIPDFPKDQLPASHRLLQLKETTDTVKGIVMTSKGPMLIASHPVLNNNREGPVRGAVIMGRLLNEDLITKLREQIQVKFDILPAVTSRPAATAAARAAQASDEPPVVVDDSHAGVLKVSTTLADISGTPILPIKADIPREISAKGQKAMQYANYSVIVAGLIVMAALLACLQWTVLGPVSRLTGHAVRLGNTDDLTVRLSMNTGDEIGTLAREFDRMVERLADARKKLVEQSYESGIAEMASGTLHNVRNALTPVLVELDMLRQELAKAPIDQIDLAKKQLSDASIPEARRQDLTKFLDLASGKLATVARDTHAKLGNVTGRAKQIEQFLSDQESASRADRPIEWVKIEELVQEAANLLPANLRERLSIETSPCVKEQGTLKTHRICLLQIFGNLFTNAAESIVMADKAKGTVHVDMDMEESGGAPMVHLRISDDGSGIEPQNLSRIFERGFTTKNKVTRGLGLHWCANSVTGLNGRIYAESDGIGRGACLHVLLPKNA